MYFAKNDRARIIGNNHSGHKFEIGSTVIVLIAEPESYKCRLEGANVEWWVHPKDLGPVDQADKIFALEDELAECKRRVSLLNAVLDYARDYLNENDPVGGGMVQGYQDAVEARS